MDENYIPVWDIRNKDGKVTEGNEWAKDLAGEIGRECAKHDKGFVFCPFGGSNRTCKSFFATSLTDPMEFGSAITMMLSNYLHSAPDINREAFLKAVVMSTAKLYKEMMEQDNGTTD